MSNELSRRSSRQPLSTTPSDATSLTSFPDPGEASTSPALQAVDQELAPLAESNQDDSGLGNDVAVADDVAPADEIDGGPGAAVTTSLNGLLDTAGAPSMFDQSEGAAGDVDPQNLGACEDAALERVIAHRGAVELVRHLSGLLVERDALVTGLRRLCEEFEVPEERVVEAGRRSALAAKRRGELAEAAVDLDESGRRGSEGGVPSLPIADLEGRNGTIRGLTRLFGGTGKRKDSAKASSASVRTASSSRSASVQPVAAAPSAPPVPVKKRTERPKSIDVLSINSTESSTWNTFTGTIKGFSGLGSSSGGGNGGGGSSQTNNREPVEMSTRRDRDQLPPTLSQPTKDPQEAEWNKFLVKLMKSREQSGEEARSGELVGASRWGHEGNAGKQKLEALTRLVVSGIPMALRHPIWMELSNTYAIMQPDAYKYYLSLQENEDPREIDAILKDVPRTLTSKYDYYAEKGYDRLKKVLIAFVNKYPGLGYTQGLNMIAGYLLLAIPDESDAFWVLCNMVDTFYPPHYFSKTTSMHAPLSDNLVLRQYVSELLPKLSSHLTYLNIPAEHTVPLSWFLTAYASALPEPALLRIWDVWLCLPNQRTFLFNIALTLLSMHAKQILECETQGEFFAYMSNKCKVSEEDGEEKVNELIRQAFLWRKKLEQQDLELRRRLAMRRLKRNSSLEALYDRAERDG